MERETYSQPGYSSKGSYNKYSYKLAMVSNLEWKSFLYCSYCGNYLCNLEIKKGDMIFCYGESCYIKETCKRYIKGLHANKQLCYYYYHKIKKKPIHHEEDCQIFIPLHWLKMFWRKLWNCC